jgi:hypothetical protein
LAPEVQEEAGLPIDLMDLILYFQQLLRMAGEEAEEIPFLHPPEEVRAGEH